MLTYLKTSLKLHDVVRNCSLSSVSLLKRNLINVTDFSGKDLKSLLWTALDLKKNIMRRRPTNNLDRTKITLLMYRSCIEIQTCTFSATTSLNCHINVIMNNTWYDAQFLSDIGRFFSTCCDIIFCQARYQTKLEKLVESTTIPVVNVESCSFSMINALADMMTLQEKYDHLTNLNIGIIGKPCPLTNTFLYISSKLGINVKFCCSCSETAHMSPATLPLAEKVSSEKHTNMKQCFDAGTAIDQADVIVITKHDIDRFKVDLPSITKSAHKDWCILHELPRSGIEVTPEVFNHANSIIWKSKQNLQWIYAALIVRLLNNYEHTIPQPKF